MRLPKTTLPCALAAIALLASGCGPSAAPEGAAAEAKPTPIQAAAAKAKAATEATQDAAEQDGPATPEETDAAAESVAPGVAYTPPFPDRIDLFSPPKQGARLARQTAHDSADSVVLMGFADLDGPRVVLSIDGLVKPLSNGEEVAGVKVISIAPPRAVLQRGRSRWTASIE